MAKTARDSADAVGTGGWVASGSAWLRAQIPECSCLAERGWLQGRDDDSLSLFCRLELAFSWAPLRFGPLGRNDLAFVAAGGSRFVNVCPMPYLDTKPGQCALHPSCGFLSVEEIRQKDGVVAGKFLDQSRVFCLVWANHKRNTNFQAENGGKLIREVEQFGRCGNGSPPCCVHDNAVPLLCDQDSFHFRTGGNSFVGCDFTLIGQKHASVLFGRVYDV